MGNPFSAIWNKAKDLVSAGTPTSATAPTTGGETLPSSPPKSAPAAKEGGVSSAAPTPSLKPTTDGDVRASWKSALGDILSWGKENLGDAANAAAEGVTKSIDNWTANLFNGDVVEDIQGLIPGNLGERREVPDSSTSGVGRSVGGLFGLDTTTLLLIGGAGVAIVGAVILIARD